MKLLGYTRVKGTSKKDNKPFDFMQLTVEETLEKEGPDYGGTQILIDRNTYKQPVIDTAVFLAALKAGLHVGDDIELYRDFKNRAVIRKI